MTAPDPLRARITDWVVANLAVPEVLTFDAEDVADKLAVMVLAEVALTLAAQASPTIPGALLDRFSAATPGPLQVEPHSHPQAGCRCLSCDVMTGWRLDHPDWVCCDEIPAMQEAVRLAKEAGRKQEDCVFAAIPYADAEFLAHAQEDVAYLLAENGRLSAEVDQLRATMEAQADW